MLFLHPVAIKPYLKKYITYYKRTSPYFLLDDKNRFGSFLINSLRHKRSVMPKDFSVILCSQKDSMLIGINDHFQINNGLFVTPKHQVRFNNFVDDEFYCMLTEFMLPNLDGNKGTIRKLLFSFRNKYQIFEDDLPYKTLERRWQRIYQEIAAAQSA